MVEVPQCLLILLVFVHLLAFVHFAYITAHLGQNYHVKRRTLTLSFFFYYLLMALERLAIAFSFYNIAIIGLIGAPVLSVWFYARVFGGLFFIAAILFLQSRLRLARKERRDGSG